LASPWGQNHYPENYKFHNFGRGLPALHHDAYRFSSTYAVVEKIFENWLILGSFRAALKTQATMKFTISFPFTDRCYRLNLVEIGSVVPEKKLKMFKSFRLTNDDGRKWIAIGHLSHSGDLKIVVAHSP
jgi:hypothetical protein